MAPTVIAHGNICHDLLQDRLPFRILLVLGLRREQLCSKFLRNCEHEINDDAGATNVASRT